MFQRWPGYQTPSWFIALLFAAGFILDYQRISSSSLDGQVTVQETSRKRVTSSEILRPLRKDNSIAEK